MFSDVCNDNRFELIEKYKRELLEHTNIETNKEEMSVIDRILFRCWQMGWLDKLNVPTADVVEVVRCKDCKYRDELCMCCHPRHEGILPLTYPLDFCSYGERKPQKEGAD